MKIGIVGGGVLGLVLAYRLSAAGHEVQVFEASAELGGLAGSHDYGSFTWDRFYHCILPSDTSLINLLVELGLEDELRWTRTGTGYYAGGRVFPMSDNMDFLRFPLLSWADKLRLSATLFHATRFADPWKLYEVSARDWLVKWCGSRCYEVFWRPMLRAKFGPYQDQVAAVFIWATLTRLFGARSTVSSKENLGYCRGGYDRILGVLEERLLSNSASLRPGSPVVGIQQGPDGCSLAFMSGTVEEAASFDQVFFTAPTRLARSVVRGNLSTTVKEFETAYPTSSTYLGVACLVLALKRPLTPFYVLNIGDESVDLTGLIEMTNLIDAEEETAGLSVVYVPKYVDSEDAILESPAENLADSIMAEVTRHLFPELKDVDVAYRAVHRARYVQPLPLVGRRPSRSDELLELRRPFQMLNTAALSCATLNNNEVVALVERFMDANPVLGASGAP